MILKNVHFYNEIFEKETADIEIENGKIKSIGVLDCDKMNGSDIVDLNDFTVIPGFIDIHIHGSCLGDFCDNSVESLEKMSNYLAKNGVTSFCPTTMTLSQNVLVEILKTGVSYIGNESGAKIAGFNLEGPFISMEKKGAQNAKHVRAGSVEEFQELFNASNKLIKIITIAPESFESANFIKEVSKLCKVAIGHSNANSVETKKAVDLGVRHATHLFNAMTPMTHREAGIVGTVLDSENVMCELICDGGHISPTVLRNTFKILGEDRAVVISDAMRGAGAGKGKYNLGGQDAFVLENAKYATLSNGTIAASISNIYTEFKNLIDFKIDFKTALKSCTINPAKVINEDNRIGSIAVGKDADLVVLDSDLTIKEVYVKGESVNGVLS